MPHRQQIQAAANENKPQALGLQTLIRKKINYALTYTARMSDIGEIYSASITHCLDSQTLQLIIRHSFLSSCLTGASYTAMCPRYESMNDLPNVVKQLHPTESKTFLISVADDSSQSAKQLNTSQRETYEAVGLLYRPVC